MLILHLSADFPDPFVPGKTRAVSNLLDLVPEHDHEVYSLNRVQRVERHLGAIIRSGPERRRLRGARARDPDGAPAFATGALDSFGCAGSGHRA